MNKQGTLDGTSLSSALKRLSELGMMDHGCNLGYLKVEKREIQV